jgi:hypothetical protein
VIHKALADTSSADDAALVVKALVELLPANDKYDPFTIADARFASHVLSELFFPESEKAKSGQHDDSPSMQVFLRTFDCVCAACLEL